MKKSTLFTIIMAIAVVTTFFLTSCDKKQAVEPMNMHESDVTMTYTPNPATVNTPITFNISVMESGKAADVSDASCGMAMGGMNMNGMTMTKTDVGMFMGTYTFTQAGDCKVTFNYKHDGEMMMKEFTVTVK